jgi:LPS-assembly lipoprotein
MSTPFLRAQLAFLGGCLLALGLSGCGFELRGTATLPESLSPTFVEGGGPVAKLLRRRLETYGRALAPAPKGAKSVIRILQENPRSRVLSVNQEGKVIAYELSYQVSFSASTPEGNEKIPPQTLDLVRDYVNPDTQVLGKQLEADLIYSDLQEDAVQRILQQVRTRWQ